MVSLREEQVDGWGDMEQWKGRWEILSPRQNNHKCEKEGKKSVEAGWDGWGEISDAVCDGRVSAQMKEKKTLVRAAMLSGSETVALMKRQEAKLEVVQIKSLSFSLVTRLDRIRNEYNWKT